MRLYASVFGFFQAEDGIRDLVRSRGLGDVYKRQAASRAAGAAPRPAPRAPPENAPNGDVGVKQSSWIIRVICSLLSNQPLDHNQRQIVKLWRRTDELTHGSLDAVSYTHLTLPTSDLV